MSKFVFILYIHISNIYQILLVMFISNLISNFTEELNFAEYRSVLAWLGQLEASESQI